MGNEEGEAVRFIDREAFAALLAELEARRYELIGPTVRKRCGDAVNHSSVGNTISMRKSSNAAQSTCPRF